MEALEIDLVPDQNVAVADLFDKLHAKTVLTRFGQAYGRLPRNDSQVSPKQIEFVEAAVEGSFVVRSRCWPTMIRKSNT